MASHIGSLYLFLRMIQKVKDYIQKNNLINEGDHVVLGVSGGPDSMCLLSVLHTIYGEKITIHVVHVNHSIRPSADDEAEFVSNICKDMGIICQVAKVDAAQYAKEYGMSTEEAGRILRYKLFEKTYNEIDVAENKKRIAVAHNMNDNAETMLLNMFRGSALGGLIGIRASRDKVIRPLLNISRAEIEQYLDDNNISYCIDESNMTDDYARNRVRHHIIPVAEQAINSGAVRNMMELSDKVADAKDYIDSQVEAAYKLCCISDRNEVRILSGPYSQLHGFIARSLLYKVFGQVAGRLKDVESKHIDIIDSLFAMDTGKQVDLPYGVQAIKTYDAIDIRKINNNDSSGCQPVLIDTVNSVEGEINYGKYKIIYRLFDINVNDSIPTDKYTKWFDYDKIENGLMLRTRMEGDYLSISDDGKTKKLKDYYINEKVPKYERDYNPLIADGSHILWVLGKRISSFYKVTSETKRVIEVSFIETNGEEG